MVLLRNLDYESLERSVKELREYVTGIQDIKNDVQTNISFVYAVNTLYDIVSFLFKDEIFYRETVFGKEDSNQMTDMGLDYFERFFISLGVSNDYLSTAKKLVAVKEAIMVSISMAKRPLPVLLKGMDRVKIVTIYRKVLNQPIFDLEFRDNMYIILLCLLHGFGDEQDEKVYDALKSSIVAS